MVAVATTAETIAEVASRPRFRRSARCAASAATETERDGDVGVLGKRVAREPPDLEQGISPEGADRSRNGRHAAEHVVEAAVEIETGDVVEVLPQSEQGATVADFRVARHGADAG